MALSAEDLLAHFNDLDKQEKAAADLATRKTREALLAVAEQYETAPGYAEGVADELKRWAGTMRIENVEDWLNASGWAKLYEDEEALEEIEREFLAHWGGEDATLEDLNCAFNEDESKFAKDAIKKRASAVIGEPFDSTPPPEDKTPMSVAEYMESALQIGAFSQLELKEDEPPPRWLKLLLRPWVVAEADRLNTREADRVLALPLAVRPKAVTKAGKWTPMPRALDIAAVLGGPLAVEMNGERYLPEPHLAGESVARSLNPRALDIVPEDWLGGGRQLSLALDLSDPPDALKEYLGAVVETAAKTAHLASFPNLCPKLLGYMFATAPMTGRGVRGKLGDIALDLYPDWKTNRRSTRDLEGIGAAFVAIKSLRLVESEADGTLRPYDLFILDYALSANPDKEIGWRVNPWLAERMQGGRRGGYFLLNMTRWLSLGIQNPRLFPLALRLAAKWDAARVGNIYTPARLKWITADRLAWECNTLPDTAAAYRFQKKGDGKRQLLRARENLEADLEALKAAGLCGPFELKRKHGEGFHILPKPPEDYAEACLRASKAAKTKKNPAA
jgi:hypothetical protein